MSNSVQYNTLENCSFEELYQCFICAFGDYQVPMDLSTKQFSTILLRNGFDPKLSIGVFLDNRLIGFIFNGVRQLNSFQIAYDGGTAVLPEHRGTGIASQMIERISDILIKHDTYAYVLECLKDNEKAVKLYQGKGFVITRNLDCYQVDRQVVLEKAMKNSFGYTFEEMSYSKILEAPILMSSLPTWQNSDQAILSIEAQLSCCKLNDTKDRTIAYAVWSKENGSIARLCTWDFDAASLMLAHIAGQTKAPTLKMINIDPSDRLLPKALTDNGFSVYVSQYEMLKLLK